MDQPGPDTHWYLAHCKPSGHLKAVENLRRQGIDCFLPMTRETRRVQGRFADRPVPLFPGYIFFALDPARTSWSTINATRGIARVVSFGTHPQPVSAELIAELQGRCDGDGFVREETGFETGDQVSVTAGPFSDLMATVLGQAPDQRVWVLLDVMGREARVVTRAGNLRPRR